MSSPLIRTPVKFFSQDRIIASTHFSITINGTKRFITDKILSQVKHQHEFLSGPDLGFWRSRAQEVVGPFPVRKGSDIFLGD